MHIWSLMLQLFRTAVIAVVGYVIFLAVLTIPFFQNQVIYLNKVTLTWFKDVNIPEQWGFLRNQVTPFFLRTPDGESLHAWHILPLGVYHQNEEVLRAEPTGSVSDITSSLSFKLLRDDPDALLVLYFHGAAGTLGSGYRPPSYRAIYAGSPSKIHIVAIDYRGFGKSTGSPSEPGLLTDALTLVEWAMNVAEIPPSRIAFFAQSLGTAVAISLARHLSMQTPPVLFAGMVFVAPFADVETLTATYKVAGTIPILSPVAYFPSVLALLNTLIKSKWSSKQNLADFIRGYDAVGDSNSKYQITIIHAEDDYDIPWSHTEQLFWHAVNASTDEGISYEALERKKAEHKLDLGAGGWIMDWQTGRGIIREIIIKHGLHDITMSYPVVSLAILKTFGRTGLKV